jgi:hypothetical protein
MIINNKYTDPMAVLQQVQQSGGHLLPQWQPGHAQGHTHFPQFESGVAEQMMQDLEYLASADYLDKLFFDRLSVCPSCGSHHINVREACSACKSPHISPVSLLHHFRCGYVGPAEAFAHDGKGRICPKCHGRLEDLGTDHDAPGENFTCHSCHASFQVPEVEGLCMACQTRTPGDQLLHRDIHSFRLNSLGMAALNIGRLFDQDEELLLEGEGQPIYRRHVFMFLLEDEMRRAKRYGTAFSLIMLRLGPGDGARTEKLVLHMAASLRNSDKIGRYSEERLLILLPATDRAGADIWLQRFLAGAGNDLRASVVELDPGRDLASQLEQPWNT